MSPYTFINIGYLLILFALTVKDILWLRSIFILAHVCFISFAALSENLPMALWNGLFLLINLYHVVKIITNRRPVVLPDDLKRIHEEIFSMMSARDFLYFWHLGRLGQIDGGMLIQVNQRQEEVLLLLSGTVKVIKDGKVVARLSRGSFLGEMSFLTGELTSADVEAEGAVRYLAWNQQKLRDLQSLNPTFFSKIHFIFGQDLSRKIKAAT